MFILHGFVKGIPYELEEAAWIDGCSPEGTFFRIIFPLLKPVQVTVLILNGIWIWNDYLLPSLMLGLNGRIENTAGCGQQFCRLLCEAVGFDLVSGAACHDTHHYPVPVCAETDHTGYGGWSH